MEEHRAHSCVSSKLKRRKVCFRRAQPQAFNSYHSPPQSARCIAETPSYPGHCQRVCIRQAGGLGMPGVHHTACLQSVRECHEARVSQPGAQDSPFWSDACPFCSRLVSRCNCVPSESLLFAPGRHATAAGRHAQSVQHCQHARAISARLRSTQEQIEKHPRIRLQYEHNLQAAAHGLTRCVICLDEFTVGDILKQLPCDHCFHSFCIAKWLHERSTCPICQQCSNGIQQQARSHEIVCVMK